MGVRRGWRYPQPLAACGHRRRIDRLHVNIMLIEQYFADVFVAVRIADPQRQDMAVGRHQRNAGGAQAGFQMIDDRQQVLALGVMLEVVFKTGQRGGHHRRR